jgi:hypothetical protein
MASQVSKNIQALADAAEEKRRQQEQGFDPSVAGLGLGGGFVASQVGGQASTSSKLSPFAQQVAAADTARLNPPINPPKSNPILGRNVPTNPLNPSVGPMTKQPSLTAAQEAASRAAEETARRGPSAMAKISQFVDNALSGASKFARAVNIPSLLLTPNAMGDSTLTGNNIILSPFDQMAADNLALQEELAAPIANMPQQQQDIAPVAAPNQGPVLMPQEHSYVPQFLRSYEQATRPRRAAEAYLNLPDGPTDPLNPPRPDEGALFETINKEQSGGRIDWDTLNRNRRLYTSGAEGESRDETIAKFANWSMGRLGYEDAKTTQKNAARTLSSPQPTFSQMFGISQSPEDAASRLGVSPRETPTPEPPILEQAGGGGLEDGSQATAKTDTQQVDLSRWFGRDSGSVERATPPDALTFVPNERIQGMDEDYVRQMGFSSEVIAQNPTALAAVQKKALRNPVEIEEPERFPAPSVNDTSATSRMDIAQPSAAKATSGDAQTDAQLENLSPAQQNFLARKEKGTPLEPNEIIAAQRYAGSQGQIFDPETGYSQAEFYGQRYKGQSIGDYLRGADTPQGATEQFVDPQGRLRRRMAGTDQLAPEYSSYERESAAREARLAARPDFMEAQPSQARKDGVMSMAQAVKVAGGDRKKARSMIELQKMGRDPITGQLGEPEGMTEYQTETLRQNQERIDFAKEEAQAARKAAEAKGATQAQRDAFEMKQKELNYAITYQNFLKDQEDPVFDAKDIDSDLDSISDQLDIIYDPESGVFRRGKIWGEGEVIKIDDPKNASIVRTIGTYKVGKALLDKYPKKG